MSKICQKCGAQNDDSSLLCISCGKPQDNIENQQAIPSNQEQPILQQPVYQQSTYQQPVQQPTYQQSGYQQPVYQQPIYQQPMQTSEVVSIGSWIGYMFLCAIPLVNIIVLIVLAVGGSTKKSLKNWAIAQFIIMLIGVVLMVVFWGILASALASISNGY